MTLHMLDYVLKLKTTKSQIYLPLLGLVYGVERPDSLAALLEFEVLFTLWIQNNMISMCNLLYLPHHHSKSVSNFKKAAVQR